MIVFSPAHAVHALTSSTIRTSSYPPEGSRKFGERRLFGWRDERGGGHCRATAIGRPWRSVQIALRPLERRIGDFSSMAGTISFCGGAM